MQKEINVILGERVKQQRWRNNMTRETLAERINVSPRFLADVEAGKIGVSIQTLKTMSVALKTSADYLLGLDNEPKDDRKQLLQLLERTSHKYDDLLGAILQELNQIEE